MSGGIDSSMAAVLLQKAGYQCIGVQMIYWTEDLPCSITPIVALDDAPQPQKVGNRFRKIVENKCCSDESLMLSRSICKFLGIPFYTYNVKAPFKEKIVDFYLQGIEQGSTPNPCIQCNKYIKFGELLDFAKSIGADAIATGHYSKVLYNQNTALFELHEAKDKHKDQSYFLSGLDQEQLSKIILPLGTLEKTQVRAMAEEVGLTAYKKSYKESQGLCFYAEKTPHAFLERHLPQNILQEGSIVDIYGNILGTHKGCIYYTVGQRKGLDIGGLPEAYFVIRINHAKREVVIGPKEYLYQKKLILQDVHFIGVEEYGMMSAKIRYRMPASPCILSKDEQGRHILQFSEGVYAITPGQVAVLQDEERIIGQGIIVESL